MGAIRATLGLCLALLVVAPAAYADPPIPPLTGRVVDDAHVLSPGTISILTARLQTFEQQTTNQLVVATLPDMKGYQIEDWGLALLRGWGIGQKDRNNGVVLVVAPNDRQLRIEVGYGLEGNLPDATAYRIIQDEIIPRFKAGDVDGGVTAGVDAIIAAIGGTYRALDSSPQVSHGVRGILPWIFQFFTGNGFFFIFVIFAIVTSIRRRWDPKRNRYIWYLSSGGGSGGSSWSSGGSSSGGFSGGGGSGGGGGASGRW